MASISPTAIRLGPFTLRHTEILYTDNLYVLWNTTPSLVSGQTSVRLGSFVLCMRRRGEPVFLPSLTPRHSPDTPSADPKNDRERLADTLLVRSRPRHRRIPEGGNCRGDSSGQ